ncbi:hypothetical protein L195_g058718, partial [Trifolium pratense]
FNFMRKTPMLLNLLNLATGMQDRTPLVAQDLRKSVMNSKDSNPFSENDFSIYTDRNHAARGCFFSHYAARVTAPRRA